MVDNIFRTIFKYLLITMATLLFVQAIVQALGELTFLGILALASIAAYFYREHGKSRGHFDRPTGALERQRVDPSTPGAGDDSEND